MRGNTVSLKDLSKYGVKDSLYKISTEDRSKMPKTGINKRFECKLPNFNETNAEEFDLFSSPNRTILEDILLNEAEKLCLQSSLLNRVVYDCSDPSPFAGKYNYEGDHTISFPYYIPENTDDVTLIFESRFETGNLKRAIQISPYEYNIILNPDYNTSRYSQWFFYSISNTRKNVEYKFNIINLIKPDSLHNNG